MPLKSILISTIAAFVMLPTLGGIPPVSTDGKVLSLAPMLKKVTPAVVNIAVTTTTALSHNPLFNDPFFRQFFGDLSGLGNFIGKTRKKTQSAGSGVIIDAKRGIVVTNHHVIAKASSVLVTLKNRKTFNAKIIGVDPATDLAVLQIPANQIALTAATLANSDYVAVGDFVTAIGNPFAIGQTVTSGIVSALGRSGLNVRHFEDFIQTDAAINPGNSGGALVSLQGELIGINTSIISPAGASVGIGFAIPVNMMKIVVAQILKNGKVTRGAFGVYIQDLTDELAKALGIALRDGAVLAQITANSQAAKAGLLVGDLVIAMNGISIRSANHLKSQLALLPPDTPMTLKIIRERKTKNINGKMGHSRKTTRLTPKI